MNIIERWRLNCWLFGSDPGWLELCSGATAIYFGLALLITPGLFEQTPSYEALASIFDQRWLGGMTIALGAAQIVSMWFCRRELSWLAATCLGILWALIGVAFFISSPTRFGVGLCTGLALAMVYTVWYRCKIGCHHDADSRRDRVHPR